MTKDVADTYLVCQRRNQMRKKTASLHPVGVPNRAFAQYGMHGPTRSMHGPSRSIVRCSCVLSNGVGQNI